MIDESRTYKDTLDPQARQGPNLTADSRQTIRSPVQYVHEYMTRALYKRP